MTRIIVLPQNARNTRKLLLRDTSHGWHGLAQMVRVRGDVNNGLKADGMVRIESDKSDKSAL